MFDFDLHEKQYIKFQVPEAMSMIKCNNPPTPRGPPAWGRKERSRTKQKSYLYKDESHSATVVFKLATADVPPFPDTKSIKE